MIISRYAYLQYVSFVPDGSNEKMDKDEQPLCFFLAVTTIQRMIDLFYGILVIFITSDWTTMRLIGDNRVCISMNECERYLRSVSESAPPEVSPLSLSLLHLLSS